MTFVIYHNFLQEVSLADENIYTANVTIKVIYLRLYLNNTWQPNFSHKHTMQIFYYHQNHSKTIHFSRKGEGAKEEDASVETATVASIITILLTVIQD